MKKQKNLIQRLYRVSEDDDKRVKQMAKIYGGESAFIRKMIREAVFVKKVESPFKPFKITE